MSREPIRKQPSDRYVVVIDTAAPGEKRRQTKKRFDTHKGARRWLSETRVAIGEQRFVTPARTTLQQWVEQWVPIMGQGCARRQP